MKGVLQLKISALQNLSAKYLQNQPGDLNSPHFLQQWWQL
jgi:hypothetical protein